MKKILSIMLSLILLISFAGCINHQPSSDENVDMSTELNEKEVTIVVPYTNDYMFKIYTSYIRNAIRKLPKEKGITVHIEKMDASNFDTYLEKRNMKLYLPKGPTLILIHIGESFSPLVEQGAALNVSEKIPNLKNVYDSLRGDYFVPAGIQADVMPLKRDVLKELKIQEPKISWTNDDYKEIKTKWLRNNKIHLTPFNCFDLIIGQLSDIEYYNSDNNRVTLNTDDFQKAIKNIRQEIFSGNFILDESYTYENYYNMIFERDSKEFDDAASLHYGENAEKQFVYSWGIQNYCALDTLSLKSKYKDNTLILPDPRRQSLSRWGFIVNANGKNLEEGMEFLNILLSDEIQFKMLKNMDIDFNSPVITTIEKDIEESEKENSVPNELVEVRRYTMEQIKNGNLIFSNKDDSSNSKKEDVIGEKVLKLIIEIVFADEPYSDNEISKKLKDLENQLNIYLNE